MNNIEFILKIEKDGRTVLSSSRVTQEIFQLAPLKIKRNMNDERVSESPEKCLYGCIIQTDDDPAIDLIEKGGIYTIYSIIPFKQHKDSERKIKYIEGSLEDYDDFTICRPIFDMYLINYRSDSNGKYNWFLEFEEV